MGLEQQKVVVMGGSSGIGLATVRQLAARGAAVVATGRDAGRLRDAVGSLGSEARVTTAVVDARERASLDAFFAQQGGLDHLVLTLSGGEGAGPFAQLDLAALRRGFEDKFWPQIEAAQAAVPYLRAGGSITFIGSISARIARPGTAGLAAINGALEAMVGTLARELAPSRVNAVSPGVIDTSWWDQMPAQARAELFRQEAAALPVGRIGQADDVAKAVLLLVENGFVTGTVLACDGGLHLL